ncbi:hypothetical protein Pint_24195 [Pistacia integerrima]|uniref:Uncharacterized protein n=1 Tax=Pistacia integerrima TaxID=434235 RepID=A0ACC0YAK9_9ROSI|nr:hypothetical protein Pint_24195 [Pistacia integerrima]
MEVGRGSGLVVYFLVVSLRCLCFGGDAAVFSVTFVVGPVGWGVQNCPTVDIFFQIAFRSNWGVVWKCVSCRFGQAGSVLCIRSAAIGVLMVLIVREAWGVSRVAAVIKKQDIGRQIETSFGSKTRQLKWEVKVEYMFGTPDCMEHGLKGSNGQFLGPTIRNKAGDTISVEVTNKLHTEGVVIHWHGITQLGTPIPWADGTPSVSQYAINPGETFLYRFKVNRAGTYVYHGHFGMQRSARLYGSLIVDVGDGEKGPFHYDGVHDQEVDLSSKPFRWTRGPRKLLIKDDKEIRRKMASVHGSTSNPSGSESFSPDDQLP